jgi:hypothetical protein
MRDPCRAVQGVTSYDKLPLHFARSPGKRAGWMPTRWYIWSNQTVLPSCDEMAPKSTTEAFDPRVFLAKVGVGKTVIEFQKNQIVFAQGDVADTVFYIQKGKIKLTVMSEQGKEAVVAILEPGHFLAKAA